MLRWKYRVYISICELVGETQREDDILGALHFLCHLFPFSTRVELAAFTNERNAMLYAKKGTGAELERLKPREMNGLIGL